MTGEVTVPLLLLLAIGSALGVAFGAMTTAIVYLFKRGERLQELWRLDEKQNAQALRAMRRELERRDGGPSEPPGPWEENTAVCRATKVVDREWALSRRRDELAREREEMLQTYNTDMATTPPEALPPPRKRMPSRPR